MHEMLMLVCVLTATKGNTVAGTIVLEQKDGYCQLTGEVTGLTPGEHGFHVHMFGDLRAPDGASAGGHYNPDAHQHGGPDAADHHQGDLGNITADANGVAKVDVKLKGVDLHALLGRSLVVHRDPDDLKTQPAGNSGPRIAVGVIGYAEVKPSAAAPQTTPK
jgi:Cu-Zn family superoxide dismutase